MPAQYGFRPYQQLTPRLPRQPSCYRRQDHSVGQVQPRLLDRSSENAQLVPQDEELNFGVSIVVQPAHEQADDETQAAVETSNDQGRQAW
jgi:hypothetical protein